MGLILFSENWKFNVDSQTLRKCSKKISFFYIIGFELVTVNSLYYDQNTRSWQSMCQQAVLKSQIRLKTTFSNSIWVRMLEKLVKSIFLQISGVFGTR